MPKNVDSTEIGTSGTTLALTAPSPAEFWDAEDLEKFTGTAASTWRYWASIGKGPRSFRLGKRRVWRRAVVEAWLAEQEAESASRD